MAKKGMAVLNCPGWLGGVIAQIEESHEGVRVTRCRQQNSMEGKLFYDYRLGTQDGIEGMLCRSQDGLPHYLTGVLLD